MTEKKTNISQVQIVSYIMLTTGLFIIIASFLFNSSIAALIGLGLTFWGALLLYIRPEVSTRKTLLEAAISPSLTTLSQIIQELGYKGDVTYLPPKYFANPETTKICVSQHKYASLPTPEQIQLYENQLLAVDLQVMILIPSGIELSRLLEKALEKRAASVKQYTSVPIFHVCTHNRPRSHNTRTLSDHHLSGNRHLYNSRNHSS
jgi:hypothetical protein